MATVQPGGSASVGGGNTPLSFPLLPQGWPLTQGGVTGLISITSDVKSNAGAEHQAALVQASNANNRLI